MTSGNYEFQSDFAKKHQQLGRASSVLSLLEMRKLIVSSEQRARILACTDSAQLDAWLLKAASAASADELF